MRPDLTWTFKASRNTTPNNNLFKEEVAEMNKLVANHGKVVSFKDQKINLLIGESITLTDTNNVLENFSRVNNPKYVTVKENKNKLTITANKNGKEAINYNFRNGLSDQIALLTSSDYQDIIVRGKLLDLPRFQIKVEVTGGVVNLQKIDATTSKKDPRGEAILKGAVYEIYDSSNNPAGKITTNDKGQGNISLDYGKYTIKEIKAPKGYSLSDEVYEFEITKENTDINIEAKDKVIEGKILLTKKKGGSGEDFTKEAGATFDVIDSKGNVVEKLTTNENGIAITVLPFGTYTIHQTSGNEGYVYANDITLKLYEEKIYEVEIKNLKLSKLEFTKTDSSSSKTLPNTLIEIYKDDDTLIYKGKTDKNGKIEVPDLEIGKYYILEKEAPKYYRLNTEKIPFEVTENGKIIKVNMTNQRKEGNLEFTKTDQSGKKFLSDTLIEIYFTETNEKVFKGKTDKNGKIKLNGLVAGKYCIYEKKAPQGYNLQKNPICFEIENENETIKINMKNSKLDNLSSTTSETIQVPDTNKNSIPVYPIMSVILITIGIAIFIYERNRH